MSVRMGMGKTRDYVFAIGLEFDRMIVKDDGPWIGVNDGDQG